jgi:hypothetical protein
MATTTATIAISSSDLMSGQIVSLSKSNTLKQAASKTGVESTTGLAMKTLESASKVDLITYANDDISGNAAKLYVKNTGSSTDQYVQVLVNSEEFARLYGGDFMFIPYTGGSGEDIEVQPSTSAKVTLEYIAFY